MTKLHFIFLSLISYIFLSGFLFEERGATPQEDPDSLENIPTKVDTTESSEDFPLLKLKAYKRPPEEIKKEEVTSNIETTAPQSTQNNTKKEDTSNVNKSTKKHIVKNPKKEKVKASRLRNKTKEMPKIIKEVKPTKGKEKYARQKRRQTGHVKKLIFNKETSFNDIPLPFPSLASLKLESLMNALPIPPLSKMPILNALLPSASTISHKRIRNKNSRYSRPQGKKNSTAKNLDMANIRIGKSDDYTSLIFDSYDWDGYNTEATVEAAESGGYNFKYEPKKNRIVGLIRGYNAFSALLGDQSELFKGNELIKNIYIDRYVGKDSIQFIIQLKKKVQMTVLDMKNPARIIVNLYPQ